MVLLLVAPHSTYILQMMNRGQDEVVQDNPAVVTGDDDIVVPRDALFRHSKESELRRTSLVRKSC